MTTLARNGTRTTKATLEKQWLITDYGYPFWHARHASLPIVALGARLD